MVLCMGVFMSVSIHGSLHMCACVCVCCKEGVIPHLTEHRDFCFVWLFFFLSFIFGLLYKILLFCTTPQGSEFISFLLFILIHPEMLGQVRYMAEWSMALSTVRRYWTLFCDEMGTGPRWPFSNIWAAAAKASQEGICHQCPPSVRLPANQVISLLFLAGMAQKHRLSFQYGSAMQEQTQMCT